MLIAYSCIRKNAAEVQKRVQFSNGWQYVNKEFSEERPHTSVVNCSMFFIGMINERICVCARSDGRGPILMTVAPRARYARCLMVANYRISVYIIGYSTNDEPFCCYDGPNYRKHCNKLPLTGELA